MEGSLNRFFTSRKAVPAALKGVHSSSPCQAAGRRTAVLAEKREATARQRSRRAEQPKTQRARPSRGENGSNGVVDGSGRDVWGLKKAIAQLGPMALPSDLAFEPADSAISRGPGPYRKIKKLQITNPKAREAMRRLVEQNEAHNCSCVKRASQVVGDQGVCCNERCINRCECLAGRARRPAHACVPPSLLNCECTDETCPVGEKLCRNRRFQRGDHRRVTTEWYGSKGWGVAIEEPAKAGDFVLEFLGEIVDDTECERRLWQNKLIGQSQGHIYLLEISRDVVLDCTSCGNQARFLNHSCEPNCEIQLWRVGEHMRLGLFALRAIEAGEELTFNYQFQNFSRESWKCLCGTDSCQGQLGGGVEERGEASDSASGQLQRERRRRLPAPAKEVESSFARLWHAPYPYEGTFSHMGLRAWRVAHLRASSGRRAMRVPPEIWCTRWTCRAWRKAFEVKHWVKEHCSESVAARSMIERLDMDTETAADELDTNEAVCGRCGGVGLLVCCDKCPQSYHLTCAGLFTAPKGDWSCPDCKRTSRSSRSMRREQEMLYLALTSEEPARKRRR